MKHSPSPFQIFTMTLWTRFSVCVGSLHGSELLVNCLCLPNYLLLHWPHIGYSSLGKTLLNRCCLLTIDQKSAQDPVLNAVHGIMILKLPQSYQISLQEGPAYLGTVWKVTVTCYLLFKNRPMAKHFAHVKFQPGFGFGSQYPFCFLSFCLYLPIVYFLNCKKKGLVFVSADRNSLKLNKLVFAQATSCAQDLGGICSVLNYSQSRMVDLPATFCLLTSQMQMLRWISHVHLSMRMQKTDTQVCRYDFRKGRLFQ